MARSEIITVRGVTDGVNTTGTFTLTSEAFTNTPSYLQFDKGLKIKIWSKRISGDPATINVEYTSDVTAGAPTWVVLDSEELTSAGEISVEKRKPIIIYARTGKEAIRFTWSQTAAGTTYISYDIEVEPIE